MAKVSMEWYLWPIAEGGLETNDPFSYGSKLNSS